MKLIIKILIYFLILYYGYSNQIDSLYTILNKSDKINKIEIYKDIIDFKLDRLDYSARYDLDSALQIASSMKDKETIADLNLLYGNYYKIFGNFDLAIQKNYDAIMYYEKQQNTNKLPDAYLSLAETYRASAFYVDALKYSFKALHYYQSLNDSLGIARSYNRLAAIKYETPIKKNDSSIFIPKIFNYIKKSLAYNSNTTLQISNYNILGASYIYFLKDFNLGEKYLLKAYDLSVSNNLYYDLPVIIYNIIGLYQQQKDYSTALKYALEAEKILKNTEINVITPHLLAKISDLYQQLGQYEKALKYLQQNQFAFNEIYNRKKDFAIIEFSQRQKLLEHQQQRELERQRDYYLLAIFLITIALLTVILIQNKKRQRLLSKQNIEIRSKNDELDLLNNTKNKFFSIIAHDLKNPISSYKGLCDLLVSDYDDLDTNEKKEMIQIMSDSATQISELLENLLQWARTQRGTIAFNPTSIDLNLIIDYIINLSHLQAQNKHIELIKNCQANLWVNADSFMLHTIIRNLVSNAIKFTPENGEITISCEALSDDKVNISITDTGVGIPKEKIPKLFDISQKTSTAGTNQEKGTGLGLILVKEFVEKHGSKLEIESEVGKGTKISFKLPKSDKPN